MQLCFIAIAASMGSSFRFDLRNQVVNVRNTGKKPLASSLMKAINPANL
ncbi:MAG: hypothetical protein ACRC8A_03310 [Microcoleaceae cyanobacterium]